MTLNYVAEGVETFYKRCEECGMCYRYQEIDCYIHNFNDSFLVGLDVCRFLRDSLQHLPIGSVVKVLEGRLKRRLNCIHFPTGGIFPRTSVNSPLHVRRSYMQGCLVTFCISKKAFRLPIKYIVSMVLYSLYLFQCIHFPTGGTFFSPSVNLSLYVRHPYMKGCLVAFCINTGRPLHYSFKMLFNGFIFFVCISVHPLSNRRDISSYFCKFAPICKAPLYARMFGNLLYQNKTAFRLPIKYTFSMVLYSSCAFQCIHFPTGGIFPRTSVNSPL